MTITILDGGMGQELLARSAARPTAFWSVQALVEEPELVRQVHADYFAADADLATTNSYAVHRDRLRPHDFEERFAERWIADGATLVGGCCEVGPAHVAELARRFGDGGS